MSCDACSLDAHEDCENRQEADGWAKPMLGAMFENGAEITRCCCEDE